MFAIQMPFHSLTVVHFHLLLAEDQFPFPTSNTQTASEPIRFYTTNNLLTWVWLWYATCKHTSHTIIRWDWVNVLIVFASVLGCGWFGGLGHCDDSVCSASKRTEPKQQNVCGNAMRDADTKWHRKYLHKPTHTWTHTHKHSPCRLCFCVCWLCVWRMR